MTSLTRAIPNRRLTSKAVANHLRCLIVDPVVERKWSVVTARLVWKTSKEELENAKRLITNKRNQCDSIVASQDGVILFFSCLSSLQDRKRKIDENENEADSIDDNDDVFPLVYPSINYWVVYRTPTSEDNFERSLFHSLLHSSLDITDLKPIKSRNKHDVSDILTATLMTCAQDHNNVHIQKILENSRDFCTDNILDGYLLEDNVPLMSSDMTGATRREKIMRIVICSLESKIIVGRAASALQKVGCSVQVCNIYHLYTLKRELSYC